MINNIEELFPLYALGACTQEEEQQIEAYLKENPEAETELLSYIKAATAIPLENNPVAPSPQVKRALMSRVMADATPAVQQAESLSLWKRIQQLLFAPKAPAIFTPAIPILLGLLLFMFIRSNNSIQQLNQTVAELGERISEQEDRILEQEATISEQLQTITNQQGTINDQRTTIANQITTVEDQMVSLSIYTAVHAQTYTIAGTEARPEAAGKLTVDHETGRAVLDVIALADDPGTVYQLWLIEGGTPLPADVFDVNDLGSGHIVVMTALPENLEAIGISVEPPGGSETPTGDIVLLGTTGS